MCFDALVEGDVMERPVGDLLREETPDAIGNGTMAAVIVASVLFGLDAGATTIGPAAVAALALGAAVHQAVLLVGVGVLRARDDEATGSSVKAA